MNETSLAASHMGKIGGKKSVEKRFDGKSKEEISELMRAVRMTKEQSARFDEALDEVVENLNKNVGA